MVYYATGSPSTELSPEELSAGLRQALDALGPRRRVLAIPPDYTRLHSQAGVLAGAAYAYYGDALTDVLPALGTHARMTDAQLSSMYPAVPRELFREHRWRTDTVTLGRLEPEFIREVSEGRLSWDWPAQVNRMLVDGGHDLILSIGQVVPHEVIGMANFNKNIFVGTGGAEGISKSHYLGAVYGMERLMGRADSPVRAVLNEATRRYAAQLPIVYALTVVESVPADAGGMRLAVRGLFVGDDAECYYRAADLARAVNVYLLDRAPQTVVAWMDPEEYRSTWVANKAIYRSRMAIADGGTLVVIAPGVQEFGEDKQFDRLIARHGYRGTDAVLAAVRDDPELAGALGAAAHLIHGSSEGRFTVKYAAGRMETDRIAAVGFTPVTVQDALKRYPVDALNEGWNTLPGGEEVYFLSNPALGLWASREKFDRNDKER